MEDKSENSLPQSQGHYVAYPQQENDGMNLLELLTIIWQGKVLIAAITSVITILALTLALTAVPVYRADTLLASVSYTGGNSNSLTSQFGGLANLAGLGSNNGNGVGEIVARILSREFISQFILIEDLASDLLEGSQDEFSSAALEDGASLFAWSAYNLFRSIIFIDVDESAGLVTIAIEWTDPELAAKWTNLIVERINEQLRTMAILETDKRIEYLEREVSTTNIIEVERAIYSLIEAQTKNKMLANTQPEYAFRVIDTAVIPKDRIRPQRRAIVMTGCLSGLILGLVIVLLLNAIKNLRNRSE